jgi:SagB-type dehydrogenase family enzyme
VTVAADPTRRRVRRAPDVFIVWRDGDRVVQAARRSQAVPASPLVLDVLDRVDTWTTAGDLAAALDLPSPVVSTLIEGLHAHGLLECEDSSRPPAASGRPASADSPWARWSPAAHLFHLATRDVAFGRSVAGPTRAADTRPPPVLPPQGTTGVSLPMPRLPHDLAEALRTRRTHRGFAPSPLTLASVGTLLGATFGVQAWVEAAEGRLALKTSPSGGARHSLEAYVWVRRVEGLAEGLYHYRGDDHALTRLDGREPPPHVTRWLPVQDGYEGAPLVVVLASELARVGWRYGSARALRVVLIEAGHLAQTFCLVATALGLAPFCTAALADSDIEDDLGLDGQARPVVYAMGAGPRLAGPWRPHLDRPAPAIVDTRLSEALSTRLTRRASGPRRRRPRGSGR